MELDYASRPISVAHREGNGTPYIPRRRSSTAALHIPRPGPPPSAPIPSVPARNPSPYADHPYSMAGDAPREAAASTSNQDTLRPRRPSMADLLAAATSSAPLGPQRSRPAIDTQPPEPAIASSSRTVPKPPGSDPSTRDLGQERGDSGSRRYITTLSRGEDSPSRRTQPTTRDVFSASGGDGSPPRRNNLALPNGSPASGSARPSSRRALTKALDLAREAVRLDSTNDDPGAAIAAYARSVRLLGEVMERVMRGDDDTSRRRSGRRRSVVAQEEEIRRLKSIHDTYEDRMNILSLIYGIPLPPEIPEDQDVASSIPVSQGSTRPHSPVSDIGTSTSSSTLTDWRNDVFTASASADDLGSNNSSPTGEHADPTESIGAAMFALSASAMISPSEEDRSIPAPPRPLPPISYSQPRQSSHPYAEFGSALAAPFSLPPQSRRQSAVAPPAIASSGRTRSTYATPPPVPPPPNSPPPAPSGYHNFSGSSAPTRQDENFQKGHKPQSGSIVGHKRTGSGRITDLDDNLSPAVGPSITIQSAPDSPGRPQSAFLQQSEVPHPLPRPPVTAPLPPPPPSATASEHSLPPIPSPTSPTPTTTPVAVRGPAPDVENQSGSPSAPRTRPRGASLRQEPQPQAGPAINQSTSGSTLMQRRNKQPLPSISPPPSVPPIPSPLPSALQTGNRPSALSPNTQANLGFNRHRSYSQPNRRPSLTSNSSAPIEPSYRPPLPTPGGVPLSAVPPSAIPPSATARKTSFASKGQLNSYFMSPSLNNREVSRTPTSPLPPPMPSDPLRKPYHLMAQLRLTMTSSSGGYITKRLHVHPVVWTQGGAKLSNLPEKVKLVELLCQAMEELQTGSVDLCGPAGPSSGLGLGIGTVSRQTGEAWIAKLDEWNATCEALVANLGKKLGVGEGFVAKKSNSVTSWGGKLSRGLDKLTSGKNLDSPTVYVNGLSRLFLHAQLLDDHVKALMGSPISPVYSAFANDLRAATEIRLRRSSEFFASVVLTFVIRDLSLLLDKYAKSCGRWLLE